jgi:hypothetical protein
MAKMTPKQQDELLENLKKQFEVAKETLDIERDLSFILERQNQSLSSYASSKKSIAETQRRINLAESGLNKLIEKQKELQSLIGGLSKKRAAEAKKELENLNKIIDATQDKLRLDKQDLEVLNNNLSATKAIGNELADFAKSLLGATFSFMDIWNYLQKVDKGIRSVQLNMGLSGNKAEFLRKQMQEATNTAQRFGASIDDIVELQSKVNELTGRANVFTEHQIANMVAIAKGTGMANDEAGQLVGNMLALGSSVEDAKKLIEGTVTETANLGLNSLSVLKGMSTNIDKLNNYRFQNGVEGLKKMVEASKKFQFSMDGAFAAAEKFRTLEGLLEAGATLRVLGGEFAKMDEFKLSFLARNKPEEFAIEMAKLTKGMASFNKETGMFDISDVDFDKLRVVAEATGRDVNDLAKQTREFNKIEFAKKQIFVGTDEEKEMLAKLATFQKGSTIGTIQIGDKNVRLDQLTQDQIDLYKQTQKTLEQRAIDSQNFNDTLNNTIMQFKSTLLPVLEVINSVLEGFNSIIDIARDENGKMKEWAAIVPITIMAATMGLFKLFGALPSILGKIPGVGKFFGGGASATATTGGGGNAAQMLGAGKKAMYSGFGSAAQLAAIGVAAVGIGFGFKMAAEGAASLSESISKLTGDQLNTLLGSIFLLGAALTGTLIGGIYMLGTATTATSYGLLSFGAAALMVGTGIGLAALGIGKMAEGFASLDKVDLSKVGSGMMGIASAALLLANPASMIGLGGIGIALAGISALDFENIKPLENLHFEDKEVQNLKKMEDFLTKINSIDTAKLASLQGLFANANFKFTLDGDAVLKNTIVVDILNEKLTKHIDQRVRIVSRKGNSPGA